MENTGKVWPRINHGTKFGLEAQLWGSERSADPHRGPSSPIPGEPPSCPPCPMPVVDLGCVWVLWVKKALHSCLRIVHRAGDPGCLLVSNSPSRHGLSRHWKRNKWMHDQNVVWMVNIFMVLSIKFSWSPELRFNIWKCFNWWQLCSEAQCPTHCGVTINMCLSVLKISLVSSKFCRCNQKHFLFTYEKLRDICPEKWFLCPCFYLISDLLISSYWKNQILINGKTFSDPQLRLGSHCLKEVWDKVLQSKWSLTWAIITFKQWDLGKYHVKQASKILKNPVRLRNIRCIKLQRLGQCQRLIMMVPELELGCPDSVSALIPIASCS